MAVCNDTPDCSSSINAGWKRRRPSKDETVSTTWFNESVNSQSSFPIFGETPSSSHPLPQSILRRTSAVGAQQTSISASASKQVSFGSIDLHVHQYTLGDNPSLRSGPPVTIAWKSFETFSLDLDDYEREKPDPRQKEMMLLPRSVREHILRNRGFSRGELKEATEQAERIRVQRVKSSRDGKLLRHVEKWFKRLKIGKDVPRDISA